jgi:hypothetical protein
MTCALGGETVNSILNTIKKMLGMEIDYNAFDTDIIVNINSAIMILRQLGVGPPKGFFITGETETWDDLIGSSRLYDGVKTYIYLKVKSVFDPSTSTAASEASKEMIKELEWRLSSESDYGGDN